MNEDYGSELLFKRYVINYIPSRFDLFSLFSFLFVLGDCFSFFLIIRIRNHLSSPTEYTHKDTHRHANRLYRLMEINEFSFTSIDVDFDFSVEHLKKVFGF